MRTARSLAAGEYRFPLLKTGVTRVHNSLSTKYAIQISVTTSSNRSLLCYVALVVLAASILTHLLTRALSSYSAVTGIFVVIFLFPSCAVFWRVKSSFLHPAFPWLYRGLAAILALYVKYSLSRLRQLLPS